MHASEIEVFQGHAVPEGDEVAGVVTASCDTYNDASGLLAPSCHQESLGDALKTRAAEAGGTALLEPRCDKRVLEQTLERLERGGAQQNRRMRLRCQASVLRPKSGAALVRAAAAEAALGERVGIEGVDVEIRAERERGVPAREPRPLDGVGEVERIPSGYTRLGRVSSVCQGDCASSTARRGLKHAAAKLGAVAIAEANCEPIGHRWHCQAVAVGQ